MPLLGSEPLISQDSPKTKRVPVVVLGTNLEWEVL